MFRDSTPVFEFRGPWGVPIQVGSSIILLPLILLDFGGTPRDLGYDLAFLAILIGSILLHELGHAWRALIQGVPVERIVLYGGGGFCEQKRSASRYELELIVAMGPIVTLALWAGAGLIYPSIADPQVRWVIETIAWVNGFRAIMNLMPVHSLDGGRLLELALHRVLPADTAITISAAIGLATSALWLGFLVLMHSMTGVILFFFPSPRLHWQMLRRRRA